MRFNPSHYLATAMALSVGTQATLTAPATAPDLSASESPISPTEETSFNWMWPFRYAKSTFESSSHDVTLPEDVVLRGTPAASVLRRHSSARHRRRIHP
ncbi:hypothetical protein H0H92_014937 [Tricholoma furcatifolium]|nr:hypothetical protein H0H92_014937 [Tricholoma furcatifolium]